MEQKRKIEEYHKKQELELIERIKKRKFIEETKLDQDIIIEVKEDDFNSEISRDSLKTFCIATLKLPVLKAKIRFLKSNTRQILSEINIESNYDNLKFTAKRRKLDVNFNMQNYNQIVFNYLTKLTNENRNLALDTLSVLLYMAQYSKESSFEIKESNSIYFKNSKISEKFNYTKKELEDSTTVVIDFTKSHSSTSNNSNSSSHRGTLVRGHWRNQFYKNGNKLKWINPFYRGGSEAISKKLYTITKS